MKNRKSAKLSDIKAIIEHTVCKGNRKLWYLYEKEANALAVALLKNYKNIEIIMKTEDNDAPIMGITVKKFLSGGELIIPIYKG